MDPFLSIIFFDAIFNDARRRLEPRRRAPRRPSRFGIRLLRP
jgi:hypothetical protein